MGMTFWDTVRGVELADTLVRTLPVLARCMKSNAELLEEVKAVKTELEEIKEIIKKL